MAQVRRPDPIPNPEAKAWHGDGTAPERMWESSTPPHSPSQGPPVERHAPGGSLYAPTPPKTHPPRLPAARDDMIGAVRYVAGELGMRHAAEPLARDFAAAAQSLADLP